MIHMPSNYLVDRPSLEHRYKDVEGILQIVEDGLCHRCGACVGVCPVNTFSLDANGYPIQTDKCIYCKLCTNVCSGSKVDFAGFSKQLYDKEYTYGDALGSVKSAYIGHSTDPEIRWRGSSGGVVTQILVYLLESGQIDGALVARASKNDSAMGEGVIARSKQDIIDCSRSRYSTTPMLAALSDLFNDKGRYAIVALPCHAHAIRELQNINKGWRNRLKLIIGLYCHFILPPEAVRESSSLLAPVGEELKEIIFRKKRKGGWPNNTPEMEFTDGSTWRSPYGPGQTFSLLGHLYDRGRCLVCTDGLVEFADIAVGDPWIKAKDGSLKYSTPEGFSSLLIRTNIGREVILSAEKADVLYLKNIDPDEVARGQRMMLDEKLYCSPVRMAWAELFHKATPEYSVIFPKLKTINIIKQILFVGYKFIRSIGPIRRFLFRLGFSKVGQIIMAGRRWQKKKKAVKYERQQFNESDH